MIDVNNLLVKGNCFSKSTMYFTSFTDLCNKYYETIINEQNIKNQIIEMESIEATDDSYSVVELESIEWLLKKSQSLNITDGSKEKYNKIRRKLSKVFPQLEERNKLEDELSKCKRLKEDLLSSSIIFNYDDKAHVYILQGNNLVCVISGNVIFGCKTKEELDVLIKIAKRSNSFLSNYQEGDIPFILERLNFYGINENSKKEYEPNYENMTKEEIERKKDLIDLGEYADWFPSRVSAIDSELKEKHMEKQKKLAMNK